MIRKQCLLVCGIILFVSALPCQEKYDPWGVWNPYPNDFDIETESRVRTFSTGKYLESYGFGIYIVKHCREAVAGMGDFPAFAAPGFYQRIEGMEAIPEGFIIYLVDSGIRVINGKPEFRDNIHFKIKMCFTNDDECYFEYITFKDADGFKPSEPFDKTIYKRYKVSDK